LVLRDGTLEGLKWLGLALMTIDHINRFLLAGGQSWMHSLGRLTMPIFTAVLAYNLARPGALEKGVYKRTLERLIVFGTIATPTFIAIGGTTADSAWPLNIMFCFAAIVACVWLIDLDRAWATSSMVLVFALSGFLVEYLWFGVGFGIAVWYYSKRPTWTAAVFAVLFCAGLNLVVLSFWSLLALPLLWLAQRIDVRVPRMRLVFYAYYPLHFAAIWGLQQTTTLRVG
jgi:TraX protein